MSRSVEWIGKDDDEAIPARAKVRIFDRCNGQCCNCGVRIVGRIRAAFDHIIALINGGANRESNIQLLCEPCHKAKSRCDLAEKATVYRKKLKHLGLKTPRKKIQSRGFPQFEPQRTASRPIRKGYDT